MEQQSEVSLQNHGPSAGKWHVDSEVQVGSGPIVFPVLLLRCRCCSGQPDFPFAVWVSWILCWIKRLLFTATCSSSSAAQYCMEVFMSSKMCPVGWLLHWHRCVAEGELGYTGTPPHSPPLSFSLCCPPMAAHWPGRACLALSWHWLCARPPPSCLFLSLPQDHLRSPSPDVSLGSAWFSLVHTKGRSNSQSWNEFMGNIARFL